MANDENAERPPEPGAAPEDSASTFPEETGRTAAERVRSLEQERDRLQQAMKRLEEERDRLQQTLAEVRAERDSFRKVILAGVPDITPEEVEEQFREGVWVDFQQVLQAVETELKDASA
jgi:chromosome segregation ATPase